MKFFRDLFNASSFTQENPSGHRYLSFGKKAGVVVNHDSAMTVSAVYRAIDYISSQIAMLPFGVYRRQSDGGRQAIDSHIQYLLQTRPNPEMSAFAFRQTLTAWALSWGNGYAEIEYGIGGDPVALWPISPDRVELMRAPDGELVYQISGHGEPTYLPANRVFHLHGLGFDGLTGYSVISLARRAIAIGMAAEEFGASFFGNGSTLGGVLTLPGTLSDTAYERLKEDWNKKYVGPESANKPAILEDGMKWEPMGLPPGDAQFLETRKFQISDIARWYGIPPHKLGDLERATFSNIEQQSIEVVVDTMNKWAVCWEQEADYKLLSRRGRRALFSKIDLRALMRGDSEGRAKYYQMLFNMGALTVNEIRALEDMNPIGKIGDKHIVQLNMTTLDKIGEDEPAGQVDSEQQDNAINSHRITLDDAIDRITKREQSSAKPKNYDPDFHRKYIARDIKAPIWALATALIENPDDYDLDGLIAEYVDYHIRDSTDCIDKGQALNSANRKEHLVDLIMFMINETLQASHET